MQQWMDERHARARDIFYRADADGSGSISEHEFAAMLNSMGLAFSNEQIEQLVLAIDKDGSGDLQCVLLALVPSKRYHPKLSPRHSLSGTASLMSCYAI